MDFSIFFAGFRLVSPLHLRGVTLPRPVSTPQGLGASLDWAYLYVPSNKLT